eukprot:scaffold67406_cov66-Phaeocystis_antarctica.AAC.1
MPLLFTPGVPSSVTPPVSTRSSARCGMGHAHAPPPTAAMGHAPRAPPPPRCVLPGPQAPAATSTPPACTTAAAAPPHTTRGYRACTTAALRCCVAQAKASQMAKPSRRTKEPSADVVKRTERKDKRAAAAAEVAARVATLGAG